MRKSIIVTGIGGVVGQGILRNIIDLALDVDIVGVNVAAVSAGNYLCNRVYEVPFSYDKAYIPIMQNICKKENVGLIIPSTDYESFYLAANKNVFTCPIAASPAEITKMCLDKFSNYKGFAEYDIPFAPSVLPSTYIGQFNKCVVKPREGRGSRNIFVNPLQPASFDDSYVVQEYLDGPEITTTFYIRRDGTFHGLITFVRELEQGNTSRAEVVHDYDEEMQSIIQKMILYYNFRGSCNIQSRVTVNGIIPFEINCRISGTNSIRSQFGFKDVAYTVQEYFLNKTPEEPNVTSGAALRVILDIIYPGKKLTDITDKNDTFYIS